MIFNVWTFLFEVVNFVALVYILHRLLYRPVYEAIEARWQENAKAQADAQKARRDAAELQQKLDAQIATLDRDRQDLLRKARQQAEAERNMIVAEANRAVERRREEVEQQLERDRTEARQSLRGEFVQSAVNLAERFLHEACTSSLQQELGGRLVEVLDRIPENERRRLREEIVAGDTAVIESAADLSGETAQRIGAALKSLAGRPVELSVQARPELMGGVRLRLAGHVWDASLAGVLGEAAPAQPGNSPP